MNNVFQSIIIGGTGGALAGITVYFIKCIHTLIKNIRHKNRIYEWMKNNTKDEEGKQYRSTRVIASWNNLTEDRVRYICSIHKKIYLSTGDNADLWSLYDRGDRSIYEDRGIRTLK